MAEIVNLRRVRKAKARAEAMTQAGANRTKHGVPKHERNLSKANTAKTAHGLAARKLDKS